MNLYGYDFGFVLLAICDMVALAPLTSISVLFMTVFLFNHLQF